MEQTLFILGVNHRTAPVALRERLAFGDNEVVGALRRMRSSAPSLSEAALISTCNRVEVLGVTADSECAAEEAKAFLADGSGLNIGQFSSALYRLDNRRAVRHLFRVSASLDSMVIGEPQILGQVKLAYQHAAEAGTVSLVLHHVFHRAFSVAKRVRSLTLIGHGAVSVSSAAVSLAAQIFDTLKDKTVMLMGAGTMAEVTARHLKSIGIESLLITSRTFDHAVRLSRELGGIAVPFDSYRPYLKVADIVLGSLATTKPVLSPAEFEAVIRERRYRPIFLIDLGVPRNFDERLNSMENVYLYDIDDLGAVVLKSRADREREAQRAEEIVELELESFWRWFEGLDLVPAIKDIRASVESLCSLELGRHRAWLASLDPAERARVEALTHGLANKLLHRVVSGLRRRCVSLPDRAYATEVARQLLCEEIPGANAADDARDAADDEEVG